jgi:nitrous oxide reductase
MNNYYKRITQNDIDVLIDLLGVTTGNPAVKTVVDLWFRKNLSTENRKWVSDNPFEGKPLDLAKDAYADNNVLNTFIDEAVPEWDDPNNKYLWKKIPAVKYLRAQYGVGLRTAKIAAEALMYRYTTGQFPENDTDRHMYS